METGNDSSMLFEANELHPESDEAVKPYEDNDVAISSIREKVEAANKGEHIEPAMNAGFESATAADAPETSAAHLHKPSIPLPGTDNPALFEQSALGRRPSSNVEGRAANDTTGSSYDLPAHLNSSTVKKMPMLTMPEQPIGDVDGGGGLGK